MPRNRTDEEIVKLVIGKRNKNKSLLKHNRYPRKRFGTVPEGLLGKPPEVLSPSVRPEHRSGATPPPDDL
jgi:hypothetical protein